ncbi:hypothetical protein CDAR_461811 [Caerostris darwini]|uniref:Uncharacterized protein n=1 Tax=Caerostris darwini TaxID=1538125 RepID=A0AAV4T9W2_9ARAC|nr:hypothetical protein CDAR_461811 [Caerostris darwini]
MNREKSGGAANRWTMRNAVAAAIFLTPSSISNAIPPPLALRPRPSTSPPSVSRLSPFSSRSHHFGSFGILFPFHSVPRVFSLFCDLKVDVISNTGFV